MTSVLTAVHRPPARPVDDEARLRVLHALHLLDTFPEPAYEDIVGLAGDICGAPVAAISLVDRERQWFKALRGLQATQTSRDISFCAHAILDPRRLLLVPDAQQDPRFALNPLVVADPHIRFYAGTPLVIDDQPVGALCVIDTKPRTLSSRQMDSLEALGRQVTAQFDLRRQLSALARVEQEVRESERRYRHLSLHDPLTGLANRAFLSQHLEERTGRSCGVLYLDLNGFKSVNDRLGHGAGDQILVAVADRLRTQLSVDEVVARVGGDEFVVVQSPSTPGRLEALRRRLLPELTRPLSHPSGPMCVGASVGMAHRDAGSTLTGEELLQRADSHMYEVKSAKRRVRPPATGHRAAELRRAFNEAAIRPAYQLIWQLPTDAAPARARIVGAEALARWDRKGIELQPAAFIPDIERLGLLSELGSTMLRAALVDVGRWQQSGHLPGDFRVHVNVGAAQLHTGELPGLLASLRDELDVDLSRICVELTETGLLSETAFTPRDAADLKDLGVALALDDFGTGYSSLTQLRAYPFDALKIDRSFVAELVSSRRARDIVLAVLDLANRSGMSAVAEGVEDVEQLRVLQELGCTQFQGFLFHRPAPASSVAGRVGSSCAGRLVPASRRADEVLLDAASRGTAA